MKQIVNAAKAATAMLVLSAMTAGSAMAGPATRIEDAKAAAEANAKAIFDQVSLVRPEDVTKADTKKADKPARASREGAGAKERAAKTPAAKGGEAKGGAPYSALIAKYARAEGVPVALAHAVVRVESNYRASARGSAGEVGLMQIKPSTARGMGYSGSTKALYDPETNLRWGMKYLGKAYQLGGGDTCGAILRYNAGHGAKRMNKVSAAYCAKVKKHLRSA